MSELAFRSEFLHTLQARGYIHQITHPAELDAAAASGVVTGYVGFDATAPSLHVGSLVQIMLLRRLQQAGHRPIVVMGGGTTRVGDPTGRDASRPQLTDELIASNIAGIRRVFERFLSFGDGPTDAVMVDNDDWLSRFGYVEFLRTFGTHFTINRMLAFDSVRLRLEREQPLTFLEFNYMLMQSVDFLELNRRYGCNLQMGGSDQWGNITAGVDLVRRVDEKPAYGVTTPLLTTASGGKMGKTAQGAVWLNEDCLDPEKYWQFWRSVDDQDVGRFLRLFTDMPVEKIAEIESRGALGDSDTKKLLADLATSMLHGSMKSSQARTRGEEIFEQGIRVYGEHTREWHEWGGTADEMARNGGQPFTRRSAAALLKEVGSAPSIKQASKTIRGGGVLINGTEVRDPESTYARTDVHPDSGVFEIQIGKRGTIKRLRPA